MKKKTFAKIFSAFLAVVMMLCSAPLSGFTGIITSAETLSGTCGENVNWTFDTETGVLDITGTGAMYDYGYGSDYGYYAPWDKHRSGITSVNIGEGVTSIGDNAFYFCYGLTSVTIGNDVTSIGSYAFYYCDGLTSLTIPDSVTTIGDYAFYNCSKLTSVEIPDNVTSIGDYAFYYCSKLTSIEIPDSVTSIGDYAFYYCTSLTSLTIPDSVTSIGGSTFYNCTGLASVTIGSGVTSIGDGAFSGCKKLASIKVDINNKSYSTDEYGVLYNKGKTELMQCPAGITRTSYTIPDGVTSIGDNAFYKCTGLTSVTIPDGVISIGSWAFAYCYYLTSVKIPDSVTSIGGSAFFDCTSLASIEIPDSVTSIGGNPFFGTAYYKNAENWENNVLYIGNHLIDAENDQIIGAYEIKEGTKTIASYAFYGCEGLTSVTIPDSVTSIGGSTFYDCTGLASVTIGSGVTSISPLLFYNCTNLASVTITDSITSIGSTAFYKCTGLTSITIPESVTSIGSSAFQYCKSLTSVTLPDGVTSIGYGAFIGCTNLTDVYYGGTEKEWSKITIGSYNEPLLNATIHFVEIACDHEYTSEITKESTCAEAGETTYTCSLCGNTYTETIAKLAHTSGEAVEENRTEATCTTAASYDSVVYCTVCSVEISRETVETSSALGHTEGEAVIENEVAATPATEGSYDTVVYCTVCNAELSRETTVVPALGHTSGEAVIENEVPATCTSEGSYDVVTYCTCCTPAVELTRETVSVPTVSHTEVTEITEPTCTESGKTVVACSVCGEIISETEIPALGHAEGKAVEENRTEATCTTAGSYDTVVNCSVCGEELSRETKSIPASGHRFGAWQVTTEPTMTADGEKVRECSVCGETETGVEPKTGITATLKDSDGNVVKEVVISGDITEITFDGINNGTYTLSLEKETYTTREYTVTASNGGISAEFKLNKVGDLNGDGRVNTVDVARANAHAKGTSSLSGYEFSCVDINGDGKVNTLDVARLNAHAKSVSTLW